MGSIVNFFVFFSGDHSSSVPGVTNFSGDERGFDMSDVMDISCDPPGPSSGRPTPSSATFSSHHNSLSDPPEEEIQSITTHLSQVAVTQNLDTLPSIMGNRTPSLEESRGLTSSAEELSTTLGPAMHHGRTPVDNVWVPIDRPHSKSHGQSPDQVFVERPEPREPIRSLKSENQWLDGQYSNDSAHKIVTSSINISSSSSSSTCKTGMAWNRVASGMSSDNQNINTQNTLNLCDFPPPAPITTIKYPNEAKASVPSATTSEDDAFLMNENKRDKKKKKRKPKTETEETTSQECNKNYVESDIFRPFGMSADSGVRRPFSELKSEVLNLELDIDHFHTAKEYQETHADEFHDPIDDERHREPESRETIDGDGLRDEKDVCFDNFSEENFSKIESSKGKETVMMRSIHDDDDLARALEEAYSSDDNAVINPSVPMAASRSRPEKNSEMFPFKDSSSDDGGEAAPEVSVSRRVAAVIGNPSDEIPSNGESTDDRGESSADDRKTTSESDVGASPNPRTSNNSKGKKKKKKKR